MIPLRKPENAGDIDAFEAPAAFEAPVPLKAPVGRPIPQGYQDARSLQLRAQAWALSRTLDNAAVDDGKWSARRRMAFMIGASLVLWAGVIAAGWLFVQIL